MKKDYGKIAVTPGGLWNANTPYEKLTTVSRNGQGYLSFEDNKGVDPEQDCDPITGIGTKWFRIATKGDPGTTDYNELINKPFIPTALSELIADALHRTVSDQEKTTWNGKYTKPNMGIPKTDFEHSVQQQIDSVPSIQQSIDAIAAIVPEQASSENQLADKDFVNSSVSTATADFKGTYNSLEDLEQVTANANDYAFVRTNDAAGNTVYKRYKWVEGTGWTWEYDLNNSSFTAAQWAAINSAITSNDVAKLSALPTKAQLDTLFAAKQNTIDSSHKLSADLVDDSSTTNKFVTTNEKTTWNNKANVVDGKVQAINGFEVTGDSASVSGLFFPFPNHSLGITEWLSVIGRDSDLVVRLGHVKVPDLMFTFNNTVVRMTTLAEQGRLAETAYQKPQSGIPASDIANDVIPDVSQFITKSVNDLVNYYTKSETYTQSEVNALIGSIQQFHYEIYASLQDITTPATNVLYLIGPTGSGNDKYEEYVYANSDFQKIGDTSIDLSNYVTTQALNTALANYVTSTDLTTLLSGKQDTLVSGTNIKTINNQSILGSGNLDVKDIFIVEYNVTTYSQILNAYNAGKYLILKYIINGNPDDWRFLPLKDVTIANDGGLVGTHIFVFSALSYTSYISCVVDIQRYYPPSSTRLQQELTFDNTPTAYSINPVKSSGIKTALDNKQDKLVSGTNIKTINNTSVLGSGNLTLENSSNKTNDIANNDTDTTKYPSCKGVADYVSGIVGNINSILETI